MYEPNWRDDQTDQLVKALVALKTKTRATGCWMTCAQFQK